MMRHCPPGGGICGSSRIPSALAPERKKARRGPSGSRRLYFPVPTDVGQQKWRQEPAITGKVRARPPCGSRGGAEVLSKDGSWGRQQREESGLGSCRAEGWDLYNGGLGAWGLRRPAGLGRG